MATQIARYVKPDSQIPGWNSQEQARAQTMGQLAWYLEMEESDPEDRGVTLEVMADHIDFIYSTYSFVPFHRPRSAEAT